MLQHPLLTCLSTNFDWRDVYGRKESGGTVYKGRICRKSKGGQPKRKTYEMGARGSTGGIDSGLLHIKGKLISKSE